MSSRTLVGMMLAAGILSGPLCVKANAGAPPKVGDPAPALELEGLLQAPDDAAADWDRLRGKVVVLEFWGTWCAPCVAAIPHMNKLADKFRERDVRFISITFEDEKKIREFLGKRAMSTWIGLDTDRSVVGAYGVQFWPTIVLVDREGRVAGITAPFGLSEEVLEAMLAGRAPGVGSPPDPVIEADHEPVEEPPLLELSVRPATGPNTGSSTGPGRLELKGYQVLGIISALHDVPTSRIEVRTVLPDDRLDVRIVAGRGRPDLGIEKKLLAEALGAAFGFSTRREAQAIDVYVLAAPGQLGGNMVEAAVEAGSWSISYGSGSINATGVPLDQLVRLLEIMLDRPVIDETGLEGYYDVEFEADLGDRDAVIAAVRKQLGLALTPDRRDVETLVIEDGGPGRDNP